MPAVQLAAALTQRIVPLCSGPATKPSSEIDMWQVVPDIRIS